MLIRKSFFLLVALFLFLSGFSQEPNYIVTKAPFSTEKYDEFSPIPFKNGIVFISNIKQNYLNEYSNPSGYSSFNIWYIDSLNNFKSKKPILLSRSLKTKLNDGPVTFSSRLDTIYYSRNLRLKGRYKELSSSRNKLGIFRAVFDGSEWKEITGTRFNNDWFNITTPSLSHDGKTLVFASDQPGGYGGSDIYISSLIDSSWTDPVNIGPEINTDGNESYPFLNEIGELFFSSDGHDGFGGKDIYVTKHVDDKWLKPFRLDSPINSEFDDFGFFIDLNLTNGYFSSNREGTVDIFSFNTVRPEIWFSKNQRENDYCYVFSDPVPLDFDDRRMRLEWTFEDGVSKQGPVVAHCFSINGDYQIDLSIKEKITGKVFFNKLNFNLKIVDVEQPYISSEDYSVVNKQTCFDGTNSYVPGYDIQTYYWDYGDGEGSFGDKICHAYKKPGEYTVKLGLLLKSQTSNDYKRLAVSKKHIVLKDSFSDSLFYDKKDTYDTLEIFEAENLSISDYYSIETIFGEPSFYNVEILAVQDRLSLDNDIFKNVPKKYSILEYYNEDSRQYSYIVDRQFTLMATYNSYVEMLESGYDKTKVRLIKLDDSAEKELYQLITNHGMLTDNFIGSDNRLLTKGYLFLNQLASFLNRYPEIVLEIGVHTDNRGSESVNLRLSQSRAASMVSYLKTTGIGSDRVIAKGYGEASPIASNVFEADRMLNRRLVLRIIK
jgi:hypothetical protein